MKIVFTKMNAGGNDFIFINNLDGSFEHFMHSPNFPAFLQRVCKRGLAVGADGLVVASKPTVTDADVKITFYEPDGNEVEFCGNATACFVYWLVNEKIIKYDNVAIESMLGVVHGRVLDNNSHSRICLPSPHSYRRDICVVTCNNLVYTDFIVTGTGHAVAYVDDVDQVKIDECGHALRHNSIYGCSVNANFVEILEEGRLKVRTYEFGVEAETLACGTGCASAAMLTAVRNKWSREYLSGKTPVLVEVKGGITLKVWFTYDEVSETFVDLCLDTIPTLVYRGELYDSMATL